MKIKLNTALFKQYIDNNSINLSKWADNVGIDRSSIYKAMNGEPVGGKFIAVILASVPYEFDELFEIEEGNDENLDKQPV